MTDDLEAFISEQKTRIREERQGLQNERPQIAENKPERKKWDTNAPNTKENPIRISAYRFGGMSIPLYEWENVAGRRAKLLEAQRKAYITYTEEMAPQSGRLSTPEDGGSLPLGGYDARRQKLQEERHREYNQLLAKEGPQLSPRRHADTHDNTSHPVGKHLHDASSKTNKANNGVTTQQKTLPLSEFNDNSQGASLRLGYSGEEKRKRLEQKRRDEYKIAQSQVTPRQIIKRMTETPEDGGFLLDNRQSERSKRLAEQRKREYQTHLNQTPQPLSSRTEPPAEGANSLPLGFLGEERKTKLEHKRKAEFQESLSKTTPRQGPKRLVQTPEDGGFLLDNRQSERSKKLEAERKKDLQTYLSKTPQPLSTRSQGKAFEGNSLPLGNLSNGKSQLERKKGAGFQEPPPSQAKTTPGNKRAIETPEDGGFLLSNEQSERSKKLEAERQKEYQAYLSQLKEPNRKLPEATDSTTLPGVISEDSRKRLQEERQAEYNEFLKTQHIPNRSYTIPETELGLPVGQYEEKRKQLLEERKSEYNELISEKNHGTVPRKLPVIDGEGLPVGNYERDRRKLDDERKKEYNERMAAKHQQQHPVADTDDITSHAQKQESNRNKLKENRPPTPEGGLLNKLGEYSNRRQNLDDERRNEYNKMLSEQKVRAGDLTAVNGTSYAAALPPKRPQRPSEKPIRDLDDEEGGVIPGLRDHPSAEARKIQQRNQEYNDFIQQKAAAKAKPPPLGLPVEGSDDEEYKQWLQNRPPRKGWTTPTYEEILDKKRKEERAYRRGDDPELYGGMALGGDNYNRSAISDGNINTLQDERRFSELDRELRSKKQKLAHTPRQQGILNDPNWLSPRPQARQPDVDEDISQMIAQLRLKYSDVGAGTDLPRSYSDLGSSSGLLNNQAHSRPDQYADRRPPPAPALSQRNARRQDPGEQSTLLVGQEVRASADQRRKEAYRRELEEQMRQTKALKQRERKEDKAPPVERQERPPPAPVQPPPPRQPSRPPQTYNDDFSPRAILFDDEIRRRGQPAPAPRSILENGFTGLYPSPLMYPQPGMLPVGGYGMGYSNPADDPYLYYGMQNPLNGAPPSGVALGQNLSGLPPASQPAKTTPRVTFADSQPQSYSTPGPSKPTEAAAAAAAPGGFPDDEQRSRSRQEAKKSYQQELLVQMEEQKRKKEAERKEKERYEAKLEEEIRNYDPFGRGGGGAPMRDASGNLVTVRKPAGQTDADLRSMHFENEETARNPNKPRPSPRAPPTSVAYQQPTSTTPQPNKDTHARGGHGIFGEGLSDFEKNSRAAYQEELRKQIEEKKRREDEEKEKQRLEDERLLKKIEEDNARMARELEEEQRKDREKQEEAKRQQEELARQQQEKKEEEERKRREAELRREEETRKRLEEERLAREREQAAERGSSPPIPTLRKDNPPENKQSKSPTKDERKQSPDDTTIKQTSSVFLPGEDLHPKSQIIPPASPPLPAQRSKTQPPPSPPVPAQRTQSRQSRVQSADVLNQLARMRKQLQSERKRVETDLEREKEEPTVYDTRLHNAPPLPGPSAKSNVDVFEIARNREPVSVRRPKETQNAADFKNLRDNKASNSRQAFRELFPQSPLNDDALETQQRALIAEQERGLEKLRNKGDDTPLSSALPDMSPKDMGLFRQNTTASAVMLDSESAFIDIPDTDPFSTSRRKPKESARDRRRNRLDTPESVKNPQGSVTSLNPESISRKNEDRLRKLKTLAGDDISTGDPDDILARFMAKQKHNRPPSGQTLQDDSWLQPGTSVAH